MDQIERSGHAYRADDIDRLASLKVRTLRYPVLWERTAPDAPGVYAWDWADARLERIRQLGMRPIIGLLHHGCGPRWTSLIDEAFPEQFADYAGAFATRYPWVDAYTPINEPLTTARFGGLYGYWHPHARNDRTFVRMLILQIAGIQRAIRRIREINAGAILVQTEDLGFTHATPLLASQAAVENDRRWLTFDLLAGRVDSKHALWRYLLDSGARVPELDQIRNDALAPDIIGINHYLTSERFLDERLEAYPAGVHGGNHLHRYADVEAVRVSSCDRVGPRGLLQQAWDRYRTPIAVTEVHLGCTREQQLRWLAEVWNAARQAGEQGVDIRAVTLWSAFGAYDWSSLLIRENGHYEPGAFDVRAPQPRPTALAHMARMLAVRGACRHPTLDSLGWWHSQIRAAYGTPPQAGAIRATSSRRARYILILGAGGTLGRAFARICAERGLAFRAVRRQQLDVTDATALNRALTQLRPWAVINASGYVRVDDAEWDAIACQSCNTHGAAHAAAACEHLGIRFTTFSSDLVFNGERSHPYEEIDTPSPLSVYGESKAAAEQSVLQRCRSALVVRTSAFFGPWDAHNFLTRSLHTLSRGQPWPAADDVTVSPTYVPDLVNTVLDLLIDGESGIWHIANRGAATWADLAREAALAARLDASLIEPCPSEQLGWVAPRPRYSVLGSRRGSMMPSLDDALARYLAARTAQPSVPTGIMECPT